jgi:hypothetical protein
MTSTMRSRTASTEIAAIAVEYLKKSSGCRPMSRPSRRSA